MSQQKVAPLEPLELEMDEVKNDPEQNDREESTGSIQGAESKNDLEKKTLLSPELEVCPLASGEDSDDGLPQQMSRPRWEKQDSDKGDVVEMSSLLNGATPNEEKGEGDGIIDMIDTSNPAGPEEITVTVGPVRDLEDLTEEVPKNEDRTSEHSQPREPWDAGYIEAGSRFEEEQESASEWKCPIYVPVISSLVETFVNKWIELSASKRLLVLLVVFFVIGLVLLVTLLPASFIYVEYYEIGLSQNKWTGSVDYDTVYDFGCHLLAPQDEVIRFRSTVHQRNYNFEVVTSESLQIHLDIGLQYVLKRDELGILYSKFYTNYEPVIDNIIEGTVKNHAVKVTLDQFRQDRKKVELKLRNRLEYVLSGNCCPKCCSSGCSKSHSCSSCRLTPKCYIGHHVEFRFFQLGRVWIPDSVMERYLKRILLQIDAEREFHVQQKAVEEKKTQLEVKKLLNKAEEVRKQAEAERHLILSIAEANATRLIQKSYQKSMGDIYSRLNISSEQNKLSFMYAQTLANMKENVHVYNSGINTAFSP